METLAQIYKRHSGPGKFNDKNSIHDYIEVYEDIFAPYRLNKAANMIEIGMYDGFSYLMFKEYMVGNVYGIDIDQYPLGKADLSPLLNTDRNVRIVDGADELWVERDFPLSKYKWDVVIDDAAHSIDQQMMIYSAWKDRMNPGSIFVTEDIQNLDRDRHLFEKLGFEILDRRKNKNRYDNVLAIKRF